ncbi:hypothetical protein LOK49_LG03G02818 [Camellia lanceoleosa]|uniref:Uncharacterized protein n=1 Tax=Camellia lanceoleosa TaxID=1840588 RepID=A0ACC0ID93_9ERIC|nr:hypothetical protein LOK49_LG03G02818 [Camellia lanceoleosa]
MKGSLGIEGEGRRSEWEHQLELRLCVSNSLLHFNLLLSPILFSRTKMAKGLIWATADDLARNRGRVLSLYRQLLRSLNSPDLPLNLAARLAKKAEVRAIFMLASEERSLHNVEDLIDAAHYSLSLLRKGEIPKYIQ